MRRIAAIAIAAALASIACQKGPKKSGPVVAKGDGWVITADELKARLDEQSPFIRARYSTPERKKEFLENLVRHEVLARAAEKQGLADDPEVQAALKKLMVQRLTQKTFQDDGGAKDIPEADLKKFYDEHRSDYQQPAKVRLAHVFLRAPVGSPERAKKAPQAKKALAKLKAEEKKNAMAFATIARELSDDEASKAVGGELPFKSREELSAQYSKPVADAAFALKAGETSGVVETPSGFEILKLVAQQPELNRTFDVVRTQIANRLYREKKARDFDQWVRKLREDAHVKIVDAELEKVTPAPAPAMPAGYPMANPMAHGPMVMPGGQMVMPVQSQGAPPATASSVPPAHK